MTQPNYLTPEGEAKLKAELQELKGTKREELSQRLRSAIQMGDLSENADYHKAKEDQGFLEGRIQEIEAILRNTVIIEKTQSRRCLYRLTCDHSGRQRLTLKPIILSVPPKQIRAMARSRTNPPLAAL